MSSGGWYVSEGDRPAKKQRGQALNFLTYLV